MNGQLIQLLILAGIAVFLILKLRGVLGTREGFEGDPSRQDAPPQRRASFEVIDGGPDQDIVDYVEDGSPQADALASMKKIEDDFMVADFLQGAKGAYEMILMAYESGNLTDVQDFLAPDVYAAFAAGVEARKSQGLTVEANFIGVRETTLKDATFNPDTRYAEIDVKFVGEMTSVVRDNSGDIVEGSDTDVKRQRDTWTFGREMGSENPNWYLSATGD